MVIHFSIDGQLLHKNSDEARKQLHKNNNAHGGGEHKDAKALTLVFVILQSHAVQKEACWSSGNAFVAGAEGLRFKSRAEQIGHSVANRMPSLHHFFEKSCVTWVQ